jgi:CubicO group peptidase (beta-lactamase class C family)
MPPIHLRLLRGTVCFAVCLLVLFVASNGVAFGQMSPADVTSDRLVAIDEFLRSNLENHPVPGFSAVVVVGDRIVFERGYGVEVVGGNAPVTAFSPIGIGSQTKSLTAVAVMQLVEQGLLELDAPVTRYLPWFRTADRRSGEITVRMLLNNSSGLPSLDRWLTSSNRSEDAAELTVRAMSNVPLSRKPGESFEYANENWTVLGLLIEEASGLPYSAYMQRHVLDAMGMDNSTTALELFEEKKVLYGHYSGVDGPRPARPRFLAEALAAGSELRASAHDMGRYLIMLLEGGTIDGRKILSPESVELLFKPGVTTSIYMAEMGAYGDPVGYGMGWVEGQAEGRTVHHHGGNAIVMSSHTMLDREAGIASSVIYNGPVLDSYHHPSLAWLAHNLLRLAQGLPLSDFGLPTRPDPTANDYELPAEQRSKFVGTYVSQGGFKARIRLDGERLILTTGSLDLDYEYELDFASPSTAVLRNISGGTMTRFLMTPAGDVTGVDGGLIGGVHRRLDEDALRRLQEVRSSDGAIFFRLPKTWQVESAVGRITAHREGAGELEIGFESDTWAERLETLGGMADTGASSPQERTETIGPFVWYEWIWDEGVGAQAKQRLVASAAVGDQRLEVRLTTEAGQLSDQVREALLPLFSNLEIEP